MLKASAIDLWQTYRNAIEMSGHSWADLVSHSNCEVLNYILN